MKIYFLHIVSLVCGLLPTNSPIAAQVLLPQYSVWEGFAFENKQTVESREAEERFARFLLHIAQQTSAQQIEQIGELLTKAEQNDATARFLTLAEKYLYDPNSPYRNDERYLLFLQYAATHQFADYTTNPRYQKHYTMVQKNRVGMPAADFPFTTQAGEEGHLYGVQSPYILLFFHDPNCEECQWVKQQLESQHAHFAQKGVQVVAVYIDDEIEAWKSASYPSAWLSVYAPEIDQQDLYDIKALPTLYLLDTQKCVLLKDVRLEDVINHRRTSVESPWE
ncbi:MAG: DUF5106 domain-containing protein [Paludibacteraceae bacterium]|nr:DUF5106 domain-containing protein [Paludibacteraceae bacterium]